jgi:hypothetical protein
MSEKAELVYELMEPGQIAEGCVNLTLRGDAVKPQRFSAFSPPTSLVVSP